MCKQVCKQVVVGNDALWLAMVPSCNHVLCGGKLHTLMYCAFGLRLC